MALAPMFLPSTLDLWCLAGHAPVALAQACGKPNNGGFPSDEFESAANLVPVNDDRARPGGSIVLDLSVYVFLKVLAGLLLTLLTLLAFV